MKNKFASHTPEKRMQGRLSLTMNHPGDSLNEYQLQKKRRLTQLNQKIVESLPRKQKKSASLQPKLANKRKSKKKKTGTLKNYTSKSETFDLLLSKKDKLSTANRKDSSHKPSGYDRRKFKPSITLNLIRDSDLEGDENDKSEGKHSEEEDSLLRKTPDTKSNRISRNSQFSKPEDEKQNKNMLNVKFKSSKQIIKV